MNTKNLHDNGWRIMDKGLFTNDVSKNKGVHLHPIPPLISKSQKSTDLAKVSFLVKPPPTVHHNGIYEGIFQKTIWF